VLKVPLRSNHPTNQPTWVITTTVMKNACATWLFVKIAAQLADWAVVEK